MKKYDTKDKRVAFVKRKGNIITFKESFFWKGKSFTQILVEELEIHDGGAVKVIGFTRDTKWYNNIDELIEAIDWDWMEAAHD